MSTPTGRKGEPPRARLLTSSAAFEILKEKERRKQEEAEMKEKKKKEREEAKKRKEEEQRKKAEERAKKQELKAKVRAEKEAKKGKGKQPAGVGTKRSKAPDQQNLPGQQLIPPLRLTTVNAVFVPLPMTTNGSGKDWVAGTCGRWLHEDCVDDCVTDSDGNERLCFVCFNHFST